MAQERDWLMIYSLQNKSINYNILKLEGDYESYKLSIFGWL